MPIRISQFNQLFGRHIMLISDVLLLAHGIPNGNGFVAINKCISTQIVIYALNVIASNELHSHCIVVLLFLFVVVFIDEQ